MLEITYNNLQKRVLLNGRLARHSVESATVESVVTGVALDAGEVCLHGGDGRTCAVWAVAEGEVVCDTRSLVLSADDVWQPCQQFEMRVKDSSGNLLGRGCVELVDSCAAHDASDFGVSGGPMVLEVAARIEAGWPVAMRQGLAHPCRSGEHEEFVGIALNAADMGADVEVQRWGAVWVDGWGLEPGARYWLPQNAGDLTTVPADVAMLVGRAQDADTLVLCGGWLAVQPQVSASGEVYMRWNSSDRRLVEVAPAMSGGGGAAGKIPRLDGDGLVPADMLPTIPMVVMARRAISDVVRSIKMEVNPTYTEVLETIYRLLAALRAADQAPVLGGDIGDSGLPEFRGIIDDSQLQGDIETTWSSAKILSYIMAYAAAVVQVLVDVEDVQELPAPMTLTKAAICYVKSEGSQYWCAGAFGEWRKMESEAATVGQVEAAIGNALEPVTEDIEELQEDVQELQGDVQGLQGDVQGLESSKADAAATTTALGLRYTKTEVDGLLTDKADAAATTTALGLRYTKTEVDGLFDSKLADYDKSEWVEVDVISVHAGLSAGTSIKAYKRGGMIAINAVMHTASAAAYPVVGGQTLFVLDGVALIGQSLVWIERVATQTRARVMADGRVVVIDAMIRNAGAGTMGADPFYLGCVVACNDMAEV